MCSTILISYRQIFVHYVTQPEARLPPRLPTAVVGGGGGQAQPAAAPVSQAWQWDRWRRLRGCGWVYWELGVRAVRRGQRTHDGLSCVGTGICLYHATDEPLPGAGGWRSGCTLRWVARSTLGSIQIGLSDVFPRPPSLLTAPGPCACWSPFLASQSSQS